MTKKWSRQQKAIFEWIRTGIGNLLIRARAGTGKTTTIIEAITYAIERSILLCAFNTDIADELSRRLTNPNATARTLHSVGNGIVFKNWGKVQVDKIRGRKLARAAITSIIKNKSPSFNIVNLVTELASKGKNIAPTCIHDKKPKALATLENIADSFDLRPKKEDAEAGWDDQIIIRAALKAMELALEKDGTIDYDDMIWLPVVNKWAYPRFDLIIVDEAQDLNSCQLKLAMMISRGRIVIVGDDKQAIYGFRGANAQTIDNLKKSLKAVELPLTITYRCPKKVVELANRFVKDFEAAPEAPAGIIDRNAYEEIFSEARPGNFIMSRTNAPLAKICLRLVRMGKRAIIRGRDIGDALITIIQDCKDGSMVIFHENLTRWERRMIESLQAQGDDIDEEKIDTIADRAATIRELSEGLTTTDELVARITNFFVYNRDADRVLGAAITCSTVHKAKGLESDRIFLAENTFREGRGSSEEDNIWYVGVTRTKHHLTWFTTPDSTAQ